MAELKQKINGVWSTIATEFPQRINGQAITKELLASLDADFVADNIKKDVGLFGLVGTFEGSGGVFHETGSIAFHTGSNTTDFSFPVSNSSYNSYLVIAKATKTWKKSGATWVEDASRDFSGMFSSSTLIGDSIVFLYPNKYTEPITAATGVESSPIPMLEYSININAYNASSNPARAALATSVTLNNGAFSGKVATNHYLCRSTVGQTFEYDIWGWNN